MATPTFVNALTLSETLNQSAIPSSLNASAIGTNKQPAIRVLAGPLRLTTYRPFPILLDASDPLVQESETLDDHVITLISPPAPQQDSTHANGGTAWTRQIKGRIAAFAKRAIARLRRVLDIE